MSMVIFKILYESYLSPMLWTIFFVIECLKTLKHKMEGWLVGQWLYKMIIGVLHRNLVISMHCVLSESAVMGLS